jgi:hypothetical protein
MLAVECLFYPEEFILRNHIDYKTIYLEKYYNPLRLKQVIFYENRDSLSYINDDEEDFPQYSPVEPTIDQFLCHTLHTTMISEDRLLKYFFHGVRFLDIGEQLIRTKCINDFKRASYLLFEMKDIYMNNDKNIDFPIDYIRAAGEQYKTMINELLPTDHIHGIFKVHITVDNEHSDKFLNISQANGIKTNSIYLPNAYQRKQLMTSRIHNGSYPALLEEMKTLISEKYQDCRITRLKIKSLMSNEKVPGSDIEKVLYWEKKSTYFEFHYKIRHCSRHSLELIKDLCRKRCISFTCIVYKKLAESECYCIVTMRLFDVGKVRACRENDYIVRFLKKNWLEPFQVENHFVVYDSNIDLDNECNRQSITSSTIDNVQMKSKYRIGCKSRFKAYRRSGDRWINSFPDA